MVKKEVKEWFSKAEKDFEIDRLNMLLFYSIRQLRTVSRDFLSIMVGNLKRPMIW